MPSRQPEKRSSIVCLGNFNPGIYQPAWFAGEDLIPKEEAERAENVIVTPQFSSFQLDWLKLEVLPERFAAHCIQAPSSNNLLRDLVLGTFQLLRHTPVTAIGINRDALFAMESEEAWHALGHRLAPPENWRSVLASPGMQALVIRGDRSDAYQGYIQVHIEPFTKLHPWGVHISVNDHYQISTDPVMGCEEAMQILRDHMESSTENSDRIIHPFLEAQ